MLPRGAPTVSLFSFHTVSLTGSPLSPIQRTPGSPQSTHGIQGWETEKEEVAGQGVPTFFRLKGAKHWVVARNHFFNSAVTEVAGGRRAPRTGAHWSTPGQG